MFDAHSNFGYATVSVAPAPANTGTQLDVGLGEGALFPAAPFNCTVWPAGVNPLSTNAEIVRVTAVVGDTLTIVRAQEGTAAVNIAAGYQIANTTSVKVFSDIENAIAISAGTQNFQGPFTFADGGGVTWGMDNGTVTASVNAAAGGGVAISAGANSQSTGTVVFSNSNGLTFGMNGAGVLTASHDGLTSQSNQAFSASGGSSTFQTLNFANSNGFTFSNSNGSVIGSYTVPVVPAQSTQPVAASASNGSFVFSTLGFSDANGVTFGTSNGSIITASVGAGVAAGSLAAGGSTMALGQVVFSNSNGISFSLNGSTVTASHNAITSQSVQPVAASASNGSFLFSTLGFSNANGVTFGTSAGSIVTASVATAAGGAGSLLYFEPQRAISTGTDALDPTFNGTITPFVLPMSMSVSFVRYLFFMQTSSTTIATLNSASATGMGSVFQQYRMVAFSMNTGANSSILSSFASGGASWTARNDISITNSSQYTVTQAFTYFFGGITSSASTSYATTFSNYAFSTTFFSNVSATRFIDIPLPNSLSAGNWWIGLWASTSATTSGPLAAISRGFIFPGSIVNLNIFDGPLSVNQVTSVAAFMFGGSVAASLSNSAQINSNQIGNMASNRRNYLQLNAQI